MAVIKNILWSIDMAWLVIGCVVLAVVINLAAQLNIFKHLKNGTIYR
jgi:hypothetical protein